MARKRKPVDRVHPPRKAPLQPEEPGASPAQPTNTGPTFPLVDPRFSDPTKPPPGWRYSQETKAWQYMGPGYTEPPPEKEPPTPDKPKGKSGIDWKLYFGNWGLPADVVAKLDEIFRSTDDPNEASQIALAYIRGTDWYAVTYPGIQAGMKNGTVSNEADYRAYTNAANQVYRQYYGRDVTGAEVAGFLQEGVDTGTVGKRALGDTIAQTQAPNWQFTEGAFDTGPLSQQETQAYGREQAGIDTPLGQRVAERIRLAQQRMNGVFNGVLATPNLTLGSAGLAAPSLSGTKATTQPDVRS